ncbi:radical SAM protein [Methanolobus psychrotolerans]|uniref:radical SAM protein n=1 Tax=Methanolobus psychrotolerans TaxID=1874706 RepID=UPI000B9167F3|nr:radical SAM protein [Methanolobus psychrotolerans]
MQCRICEIGCDINEHSRGRCGTYMSDGNSIFQDPNIGYMGAYQVSIETIPMLHFYPSGKFMQVFSTGCNFNCSGCVARLLASNRSLGWPTLSPLQVVDKALQEDCIGVVSTLNEPAANYYNFKKLAILAREHDLLVGCSTNCYFTEDTLEELGNLLDFVNVGIKGYSDNNYRTCGVHSSQPVFRNVSRLVEMGVHVETSLMYSRGNEDDLMQVARKLSEISQQIPVQVMRFIPFGDAPISLEPSIGETERICKSLREHMDHVYLFNSPGTDMLHTYCLHCGNLLAEREFYGPMGARLLHPWTDHKCSCGYIVPVKGTASIKFFNDVGFTGGYRISRAFSMVHAVLTCMGILDDQKLLEVWGEMVNAETLMQVHHMIQQPSSYLELVRLIAEKAGTEQEGEELASFIRERLELVSAVAKENTGHPVYYCMGSPLFAMNAGRAENNLVTFAGGISINKALQKEGKPGLNVDPDFINKNNPRTIFISGFLSRPLDEFYDLCNQYGIVADAVKQHRVYEMPPSWDFGSPRWILGLLYIASKMYPGKLGIDLKDEADEFYRRFYGISYEDARPNRSFHRPTSGKWPLQMMR